MKITLIDTKSITGSKDTEVNFDMVAINLNGIDYYIYQSPDNRLRLALDTYKDGIVYENEATLYNGLLPVRRSLLDNLKNYFVTLKTVIYNMTMNRKKDKNYV